MKDDLISKLKRMVSEPKVFSLLLSSARGTVLYIGVHFSLEEAYTAGRKKMESFAEHKPGEAIDIDLWNTMPARQVIAQIIEPSELDKVFPPQPIGEQKSGQPLSETQEAIDMMEGIVNQATMHSMQSLVKKNKEKAEEAKQQHTVSESIQEVKKTRNDLMKKLIDDGDMEQVEKVGDLLSSSSRKYVRAAIEKKKNVIKDDKDKQ